MTTNYGDDFFADRVRSAPDEDLCESECSAITTTEQVAAMYEEASDLQAKQPDSGRLG